jgi:hypothetical protein
MSPNLKVSLPTCRHCGRFWRPQHGVMATDGYCSRCTKSRKSAATAKFELRPIGALDLTGSYLLPRNFRSA